MTLGAHSLGHRGDANPPRRVKSSSSRQPTLGLHLHEGRPAATAKALRRLPARVPAALATVEVSHAEALTLLALVQGRLLEVERMVQNLEEGEGMDLQRHNALRTLRPQADALQDLVLKLEGAVKELERGR